MLTKGTRPYSYLLVGDQQGQFYDYWTRNPSLRPWMRLDGSNADRLADALLIGDTQPVPYHLWRALGLVGEQIRTAVDDISALYIARLIADLDKIAGADSWRSTVNPLRPTLSLGPESGQAAERPRSQQHIDTQTTRHLIGLTLLNLTPLVHHFDGVFDIPRLLADPLRTELGPRVQSWLIQSPELAATFDNLRPLFAVDPENIEGYVGELAQRGTLGPGSEPASPTFEAWQRVDDIQQEQHRAVGPPGPPDPVADSYDSLAEEPEQFTPDRAWMPELVLLAKHTLVWLDQLSKEFSRPIRRLDDIPSAALIQLTNWGITGLWLIGLWERSPASATIKRFSGATASHSSAYSIYDYQIAESLGGAEALENLADRAAELGIRLGADMVPNHTGLDSRWVREHPEYFINRAQKPYPSYEFNGPDLSLDPDTGIFLEDHYADRSDAAVVFKRLDHRTGQASFIYHGNDGTSMPWNDTAQLDYLNPDTRQAVIDEIIAVARQFPIIRFDAAMVLARRHIRRLWYPAPGEGGAIPSRSQQGISIREFEQRIPVEFWREVVERVRLEAPDTLLLAEAFWLMEGYFVRTLGMHRVYNSAFMNLLRDEENTQFQQVLRNTMSSSPEILQRFVNFLNNPDEESAIEQFGRREKYLGCSVLLLTLPGVPMIGHGQIEGLSEKYGMEFNKPRLREKRDASLVALYEEQLQPLLQWRRIFAETRHFQLLTARSLDGLAASEVIAYTNREAQDRFLILYNNSPQPLQCWLDLETQSDSADHIGLAEALHLPLPSKSQVWSAQEQLTQREHLFSHQHVENGQIRFQLGRYQCLVFAHVRSESSSIELENLALEFSGSGYLNRTHARRRLQLRPAQRALESWTAQLSEPPLEFLEAASLDEARTHLSKAVNDLVKGCAGALDLSGDAIHASEADLDYLIGYWKVYSKSWQPEEPHPRGFQSTLRLFSGWLAKDSTLSMLWSLLAFQTVEPIRQSSLLQGEIVPFWPYLDDPFGSGNHEFIDTLRCIDELTAAGFVTGRRSRAAARKTVERWFELPGLSIGLGRFDKIRLRQIAADICGLNALRQIAQRNENLLAIRDPYLVLVQMWKAEEIAGYDTRALKRALAR